MVMRIGRQIAMPPKALLMETSRRGKRGDEGRRRRENRGGRSLWAKGPVVVFPTEVRKKRMKGAASLASVQQAM